MAERLFLAMDRPDLVDDPRFRTNLDRRNHVDELDRLIQEYVEKLTLQECVDHFRAKQVTIGPVYDISQIVLDPHVVERGVLVEVPDSEIGSVPMHDVVPRLSGTPGRLRTPAPALGEHTEEILDRIGFDADARAAQAGRCGMNARSLLYIPALAAEFLAKAHTRDADAIIVDLEDSIPASRKADARAVLPEVVSSLAARGVTVWVRVNSAPELVAGDLAAAAMPGVHTILLPKVENAAQLLQADAAVAAVDAIQLSALVETPMGVVRLPEICAATPRLKSLSYGSEDLSLGLGVKPEYEALVVTAQMTVVAARAFGLDVYGVPGSVAEFRDLEAYRRLCIQAKTIGFDGVLCIHPRQVSEINGIFGVSEAEREFAGRVVEAFEQAGRAGLGAVALDGKMIDLPVVERARRTLARRA